MSLRALIAQAVTTAFQASGDIPREATLYLNPTHAYNPVTDQSTPTWAHSLPITRAIKYDADLKVTISGVDKESIVDRCRVILNNEEVTDGTIDHTSELEIDGVTWKCHQAETDPVGATTILHLWR
jgi:hypothetical protein